MTKAIPYWHIDAFASQTFGGNQAAVMILDQWLPDDTLTAIAAENLFAETAFLVEDGTGLADYELRWFTPTVEVALCGHATLASGHVLLGQDKRLKKKGGITFRTRKAGILEVRGGQDGYSLSLPITKVEPRSNHELLDVLGAKGDVFESISGAEQTAIILLESEDAVRALQPDFVRLAGIDLMAICTAPGDRSDIVSRVFVSAWGIDEDSVTGSAHAALAPFWADRLGRSQFTAHQASQRGGDLTCTLDGDRVWLGGQCVTVVAGEFYV